MGIAWILAAMQFKKKSKRILGHISAPPLLLRLQFALEGHVVVNYKRVENEIV